MMRADEVRQRTGVPEAVARGLRGRCPACGRGRLFGRFLKVVDTCEACGTAMHHHRADDMPPYLVIFLVGHVVGWGIYMTEMKSTVTVPIWVHATVWPSLVVIMSLALIQPMKGAVVGLQYALGMHGFGAEPGRTGEGGETTRE